MKYIKLFEQHETPLDNETLINIYKNGLRNRSEKTKQFAIDNGFELTDDVKKDLSYYCTLELGNYHLIKEFWEERYNWHVKHTTEIDISELNLTDLNGITCLENLEELICDKNKISDLTPLLKLKKLYYISATNNSIKSEDIKVLEALENLETLKVRYNNIDDLSVFENFKDLGELDVSANKISSLEPLLFFEGYMEQFYYYNNPLPEELDECSADMGEHHPDGECIANFYGYSYMSDDENPRNLPYPNKENRKPQ